MALYFYAEAEPNKICVDSGDGWVEDHDNSQGYLYTGVTCIHTVHTIHTIHTIHTVHKIHTVHTIHTILTGIMHTMVPVDHGCAYFPDGDVYTGCFNTRGEFDG